MFPDMAAQLFNRIGQVGLGMALVGGVVNSALYNGTYTFNLDITLQFLLLYFNLTHQIISIHNAE